MFKQLAFKSCNKPTFYIHTTKNDNETVFKDTSWPRREQPQFRDICFDSKILVLTLSFSFWTWVVIPTIVLQTQKWSVAGFFGCVFFFLSFFLHPIFNILCALCALFSVIRSASLYLSSLHKHKGLSESGTRVPWRGRINITVHCLSPNP